MEPGIPAFQKLSDSSCLLFIPKQRREEKKRKVKEG